MKKYVMAIAAAALLPLPVQAKNLCLLNNWGGYYYLKGVKPLKPGAVVPLAGVAWVAAGNYPLSGTAIVLADGTVNYGFKAFVDQGDSYDVNIYGANNLLEGTGEYIYEQSWDTGEETMTAVDCKDGFPAF